METKHSGIDPKNTHFYRDTAVMVRQAASHLDLAPHQIYPDGLACPRAYGEDDAACNCWLKELQ
jgi:hypothetical protein